ncbi:MAG TPA: hypothetical protein VEH76_15195, partial [Methylocystis sp.]|nr:hypothetical protein [Methylocystis sp.]
MTGLTLAFTPLLPWLALIALALLALTVCGFAIYMGQRGAGWRLLALSLIFAALTGPALLNEKREPQKSVVAVVLDRSESQTLGERMRQVDAAQKALQDLFAAHDSIEPRFVSVGASNDGTLLFSALEQALKDTPPDRVGGAILVTDGLVHDIPARPESLGFKAPLHALITGKEGERDRRIELVEAPRFGVVGKDQILRAKVVDSPAAGGYATIEARRDGATILKRGVRVGEEFDIPVRVEHGGPNVVELATPKLEGELTDVDNKAIAIVEGVRDRLKVLLVSGEPHQGERSWRNLLRSDANVELVHFTILRPPEKLDGVPATELSLIAFPTADLFGPKINDFDLIIFDRYSNQTLLPSAYFDNIVNYIENGGAFLAMVGPDYATVHGLYYSPLETLLPARPNGEIHDEAFRAKVSHDGAKHPVTRGLEGANQDPPAWGRWFRQVDADVVRGDTLLLGANDRPLLVLSHEGKGRVALLLTDQLWLWARGYDGGGPHVDLMRRLAHWLLKQPDLEEEALRASAHGREITIERQSLKDAAPEAVAIAPSGAREEIKLQAKEPGLSRATFEAKEMGLYRFESDELKALVNVGPQNPRELREVASTTEKLRPLAAATGGTVRRLAMSNGAATLPRFVELGEANVYGGSDWFGIKRAGAGALKGVETAPLALGLPALLA